MKKSLLALAIALIPITAQAVPIEKDAIIGDNVKSQKVLNALATIIAVSGYKCDSISSARTMVFSTGFVVKCNQWRYVYEIEDQGGNWIVCYNECE